ncbi:MAG: imelysin family protein [Cytophagales bacterium]|nr:imelysin family protein [Cytophagales bacterium]MDW8383174.1 imelysin family protein [Flammeovirgaceae bacterium]
MKLFLVSCSIVFILMLSSCSNQKKEIQSDSFERREWLKYTAEKIILPSFEKVELAVDTLVNKVNYFADNPTISTLAQAQAAWKNAILRWMLCTPFNFGPGEFLGNPLESIINTFPVRIEGNATQPGIENLIRNNQFSIIDNPNDTKGFQALDYLLFDSLDRQEEVVARYTTQSYANARKQFLKSIAQEIKVRIERVHRDWKSFYAKDFASSGSTSAGSPTSLYFNAFAASFERIKNFKILFPAGMGAGLNIGSLRPELVEARFSGFSHELVLEHTKTIERLWYGKDLNGVDGLGYEEYLKSIATPDAIEAANRTKALFNEFYDALSKVPKTRWNASVLTSNEFNALANKSREMQAYMKARIASATGISITYSSGDGD